MLKFCIKGNKWENFPQPNTLQLSFTRRRKNSLLVHEPSSTNWTNGHSERYLVTTIKNMRQTSLLYAESVHQKMPNKLHLLPLMAPSVAILYIPGAQFTVLCQGEAPTECEEIEPISTRLLLQQTSSTWLEVICLSSRMCLCFASYALTKYVVVSVVWIVNSIVR